MKTQYLIGAFIATALIISGCGDDTAETPAQTKANEVIGQRLKDDNGVEYTLIDNGDGTETARYDDGRAVTFRRQEDGSLDFVSGAAGLIAGMAAGYFLFHGLSNSGGGTWDASRNRYTVNEPVRRDERNSTGGGAGALSRAANSSTPGTNSGGVNLSKDSASTSSKPTASSTPSTNSGGVNLSKDSGKTSSSSVSEPKTGFGGAGARAGSAAS